MHSLDLLIIGGGPAGMSAALIAGRALLKTAVVNAETPRNAVTTASHGFLTRDGVHPHELLAVSKEQLRTYASVEYIAGLVASVNRSDGHFAIELSDGRKLKARRLVLATGYTDDLGLLKLPGIEAVYGKTVYPCVFCDGFEHRGERIAVFSNSGEDFYVPMARMWSDDVTLFTNGTVVDPERKALLERRGVRVVEDVITALKSSVGALQAVVLASGSSIEQDAGFLSDDYAHPSTRFAEHLGVQIISNDWGAQVLEVEPSGATKIPGLYVVGDARSSFSGLLSAAAEGAACIEGIVHHLAAERWASRDG
jgi:thioredoxin reductase